MEEKAPLDMLFLVEVGGIGWVGARCSIFLLLIVLFIYLQNHEPEFDLLLLLFFRKINFQNDYSVFIDYLI